MGGQLRGCQIHPASAKLKAESLGGSSGISPLYDDGLKKKKKGRFRDGHDGRSAKNTLSPLLRVQRHSAHAAQLLLKTLHVRSQLSDASNCSSPILSCIFPFISEHSSANCGLRDTRRLRPGVSAPRPRDPVRESRGALLLLTDDTSSSWEKGGARSRFPESWVWCRDEAYNRIAICGARITSTDRSARHPCFHTFKPLR